VASGMAQTAAKRTGGGGKQEADVATEPLVSGFGMPWAVGPADGHIID